MLLQIHNYNLKISELNRDILNDVSLEVEKGEIVILVGENGSGKSSFAMSLLNLPMYERSGKILVEDIETADMSIDEIARAGIFVSFQAPPEIEGVTLFDFIQSGYKAMHPEGGLSSFKLRKKIQETAELVGLNDTFLERSVNQGFSGGERRKSEVLQMLVLEPKLAVLDEVDSGLDIRSTNNIAKIIRRKADEGKMSFLIISHSPEFIKKIKADRIIGIEDKRFKPVDIEELDNYIDEDEVVTLNPAQ
jgi:Fe-S cluster assembly ATP-binding protein